MNAKMCKVLIYGLKKERKKTLETLQKYGCMEFVKCDKDDRLRRDNVAEQIVQFERHISLTEKAISVLSDYRIEKTGFLSARKTLSAEENYSMTADEAKTMGKAVSDVLSLSKQIDDDKIFISKNRSSETYLDMWEKLDIPMNYSGTKNTFSLVLNYPDELNCTEFDEILGTDAENVYCEIIYSDKQTTCLFITGLKSEREEIEKKLRDKGFTQPPFSLTHRIPEEKAKILEGQCTEKERDIELCEEKLKEFSNNIEKFRLFCDHIRLRKDKYSEINKILNSDNAFIAEGFIPQDKFSKIENVLVNRTNCYIECEAVDENEESPVLFESNKFASPVEEITKTYSMPSKFDIDPNFIMAIFYYLFFGMMFSDAGYGLLVMIVTGYISFFSNAEKELKDKMRMFFFCGISTTFWGLMYGSFFGDAIGRISETFFGREIILSPGWIDPVKEPLTLLIFSVAIGMVQIITGLCIRFYMLWRRKKYSDAVFDVGFWITLLLGISLLATGYGIKKPMLENIGKWAAVASAAGLVLTQGRDKKNIFAKLGGGILSLYDITSYVSDALSYSRLMALGLSTGVIANVVNTMGTLAGKSVIGAIAFVIIFVFGHALNFSINMLGAYVHTNRLQYVEFFSKFYEGGGREFSPLKMNTKYFNFMEEEKL